MFDFLLIGLSKTDTLKDVESKYEKRKQLISDSEIKEKVKKALGDYITFIWQQIDTEEKLKQYKTQYESSIGRMIGHEGIPFFKRVVQVASITNIYELVEKNYLSFSHIAYFCTQHFFSDWDKQLAETVEKVKNFQASEFSENLEIINRYVRKTDIPALLSLYIYLTRRVVNHAISNTDYKLEEIVDAFKQDDKFILERIELLYEFDVGNQDVKKHISDRTKIKMLSLEEIEEIYKKNFKRTDESKKRKIESQEELLDLDSQKIQSPPQSPGSLGFYAKGESKKLKTEIVVTSASSIPDSPTSSSSKPLRTSQ